MILKTNLCQMFTKDVRIFLVIFFCCAKHFHSLENHDVSVLLEKGTYDSSIFEVSVKVCESSFFKKNLSDCLFTPEEENILTD